MTSADSDFHAGCQHSKCRAGSAPIRPRRVDFDLSKHLRTVQHRHFCRLDRLDHFFPLLDEFPRTQQSTGSYTQPTVEKGVLYFILSISILLLGISEWD
jgi:hypothetical protein